MSENTVALILTESELSDLRYALFDYRLKWFDKYHAAVEGTNDHSVTGAKVVYDDAIALHEKVIKVAQALEVRNANND